MAHSEPDLDGDLLVIVIGQHVIRDAVIAAVLLNQGLEVW
jgi:hypothetical protein